jgi:hypothetical protein
VIADPLDPLPRSLKNHRAQFVTTATIHTMDLGIDDESEARLDVLRDRAAQRHALASQNTKLGTAHATLLVIRSPVRQKRVTAHNCIS